MDALQKSLVSKAVLFFLLTFLATALMSGCSSPGSRAGGDATRRMDPKVRGDFEAGLRAFDQKDFQKASTLFGEFVNRYPNTPYHSAAFYNWGLSLEFLGKPAEAIEKYKQVIETAGGKKTKDETEAMYRLSICYETLNDDVNLPLTLLELDRHQSFLSKEVSNVEIPARLATAYARAGNALEAKKYYDRAAEGLKKQRRQVLNGDLPVWLPKTLYHMGRVNLSSEAISSGNYKNVTMAMEQAQVWLIRAADTGKNEWSDKAALEMVTSYQALLDAVEKVPPSENTDRLAGLAEQQRYQKSMSADLVALCEKAKLERIPRSDPRMEPVAIKSIFEQVEKVQKRAEAYLAARQVRDQLTPESQKREGIKGEGFIDERPFNPNPALPNKNKGAE